MIESALTLCNQLITMALYLIVGFILVKIKMFSEVSIKHFTNLVLYVVSPFLVLSCFNFEFSIDSLWHFFLAVILGIGIFLISIAVSNFALIKGEKEIIPVEKFAVVFSNSGFMGTPLTIFMLGTVGGFYSAAFSISFNIVNWTYGVTLLGRAKRGKGMFGFLKLFNNPFFYCLGIGLFMYVTQLSFPTAIQTAVDNIGSMTSPCAMICCGMYLASGNAFKGFKRLRIYYICFFRLIVVPIVVLLILIPLHLDYVLAMSLMIAAATPTAATMVFFSNDNAKRLQRSRELFVVSTLLCIVTMPLVVGYASTVL